MKSHKYDIDVTRPLLLGFKNMKIKLNAWDNNYIEIIPDDLLISQKRKYSISAKNNTIECTLSTNKKQVSLWQLFNFKRLYKEIGVYDFELNVPRNISLVVNGKLIKAYGCNILTIEGKDIVLRKCNMLNNSVSIGENLSIRESFIADGSTFENENINIRECKLQKIKIITTDAKKTYSANLRDLTGKEIMIYANKYKMLNYFIRHSSIDNFTINSTSQNIGTIEFYKCTIKNCNNNSNIKLK
ncbi:hypothetical protein PV797_09400 [Clostridiaceae bacterium M8S5]|nr:hypothetical protein PV797_09400 [Clostridiaceae bacterium M8S5]